MAKTGQCSTGWFYGFKLHIITADTGEIADFILPPGNVDDRKPLTMERFINKLFGDKGYISKELFKPFLSGGSPGHKAQTECEIFINYTNDGCCATW